MLPIAKNRKEIPVSSFSSAVHPSKKPLLQEELKQVEAKLTSLFHSKGSTQVVDPTTSNMNTSSESNKSDSAREFTVPARGVRVSRSSTSWLPHLHRPCDITIPQQTAEDNQSTAVSEFTTFTEGMTVTPESSYKKGKRNTETNETTPNLTPDTTSSHSDDDDNDDSENGNDYDEYRAEDLFKLLEAQQSITKCFSEIASGMAGIIERKERKKQQRFLSRRRSSSSRTDDDMFSMASTAASSTGVQTEKADKVCQVVENMAFRQDELAVKVVGIAVNALARADEKERERQHLEHRVQQLEAYIESHRRKKKSLSSSSKKQHKTNSSDPQEFFCAPQQQRIASGSFRRSRRQQAAGGDCHSLPPGFSGVLDISHTEIDICKITTRSDSASVVSNVKNNGAVRFLM